jgi:chromosome segregation protein
MRLTKLELHGFKSFADATTLVFEPGVTAIVGPNGCGKSNVSDAVRWVLGEQRARLLRGAKMDEVIFQGSSARRPVNVAEVSLHFENDDGTLPVAYREVVVSRRLSRSGESDYLLNRSPCRLRDIHDLLRGTGLGADAGVVIESQMIDALLSDRPDDRRELFEEAAGVGLYRDRRRTTERRLEETSFDLARLDDLLSEVQTQVRSLARQRRRAERHVELSARRFVVEMTLAARELDAAREELTGLDAAIADLGMRIPAGQEAATEAERRREAAHRERATAEGRRNDLARLVATQHQELAALRGEIGVAEERMRNSRVRRQRAEDERREGETLGVRVLAERDVAADDQRQLETAVLDATAELDASTAREDEARRAVVAAREMTDRCDSDVRQHRDASAHLELERQSAEREHAEVAERIRSLAAERTVLADREASARRTATGAAADALVAETEAAQQRTHAEELQRDAARARDAEVEAHRVAAQAEAAFTTLEANLEALEQLERERVGLAPAAARLLAGRTQFGEGAILGPLSDYLTAAAADAAVVERFLGATVHAVVVRDRGVADAVRQWHAKNDPGPLCLLPLDATASLGLPDDSGDDDPSLASRVASADTVRRWARALLGRVRDLGAGTAFEDAWGAIWLPGVTPGSGPLQRRAELTALRANRTIAAAARDTAVTAAAAAGAALAEAESQTAAAADAATRADQAGRRASEHLAERRREVERILRDARQAEELQDRLAARAAALTARVLALTADWTHTEGEQAGHQRSAETARLDLTAAERNHEAMRDARAAAQVAVARAEARGQVAADRARRLGEEYATASERLEALRVELASLSSADGEITGKLATWRAQVAARQATITDADTRLAAAESAVAAADTELLSAEQALDTAHRDGAALAEELHRAQLRRTEVAGRNHAVREKAETEWRRPWAALIAELVPLTDDDDTLRTEAAELREQFTALGPVNALAVEEHDEEVKRLEFLSTQRADLAAGRASLQQAIREIDETARELFLATFAHVRDNFRRIFMTLFGGGDCDLRLENPDAPLECDIEIHASPRGKRTQRIHLLSSGERALVALSLLFGIFLTKPSPFCLLDEVDAPLDDQNIGRFVRMLNEFKSKTQFIVITHNPRTTTEAADAVYGVTMQEPGVSSVVSVRLRDPAPALATPEESSDAPPEPALQEA